MSWILLVLLPPLIVVLVPLVNEWRKPRMAGRWRAGAPGDMAALSMGATHFRWHGPADAAKTAVCVHGLTTPSFVWDGVAERLVAQGYRVLVYDLYGRGYSDRPAGAQTRAFFLTQLEELIAHEGITGEFTLVGYSMGGSIATCFAAKHPDRVRRLVLVAPAGLGHVTPPFGRFCIAVPGIGDWLFRALFPTSFRRAARKMTRNEGIPAEVSAAQVAEVEMRGFVPAVLSSMRGMLAETLETEHRAIAATGMPVLAIWATRDATIPIKNMGRLATWNRTAQQAQVEGATHWAPITHPDEVARAMR
ncbi:alpha/beta fold hydrolase [Pseudooceanicola sp. LIPI14-2-Ac024]|uniref:alpha/beta fold hydrolase n=1 Tax=Pseudooceanicola sp. LIPI14-2-Ac024 TaxID=3344875 RepID=UPI0035D08E39